VSKWKGYKNSLILFHGLGTAMALTNIWAVLKVLLNSTLWRRSW
jgi:hypothetical protein